MELMGWFLFYYMAWVTCGLWVTCFKTRRGSCQTASLSLTKEYLMNLIRRPNVSVTFLSILAALVILQGVIASASAQNATEQDFIQLPR